MSNLPSWKNVVAHPDAYANATLERLYREIKIKGGIPRFGRIVSVPKGFAPFVRDTIAYRNEEGIYTFENRAEERRLKPVASVYIELGGPPPPKRVVAS